MLRSIRGSEPDGFLPRRWTGVLAAFLLVLCLPPARARAQAGSAALSKSELIRRVVTSPDDQAPVVESVERRCLSFRPTPRDLQDLRAVGASSDLLRAVETCSRQRQTPVGGVRLPLAATDPSSASATEPIPPDAVRPAGGVPLSATADLPADAFSVIESFRAAVRDSPSDGSAWAGLGRAWLRAGYHTRARHALERAGRLAPGDAAVERSLRHLRAVSPRYRLTLGAGRSGSGEDGVLLQLAAVRARPTPALHLWARYDRGLDRNLPGLVRGLREDEGALYGGVGVDWGSGRRITSRLEVGRRERSEELIQYVYRTEHSLRFRAGERPLDVTVGGVLGRWYDRDDWLLYGELDLGVAPGIRLRPQLSLGETVGAEFPDSARRVARETRAGLSVAVTRIPGLRVVPRVSVGGVSYLARDTGPGDFERLESEDRAATDDTGEPGTLVHLGLRVSARLAESQRVFVELRHQRPPLQSPFTAAVGGLTLGLP